MDTTVFAIIVGVAIIAVVWIYARQKTAKLVNDGKMVVRKDAFHEKEQTFTLAVNNAELVTQKIQAISYGEMKVSMSGNSEQQVFQFNSGTFTARLWRREAAEEKSVYCFCFNQWKTGKYGVPLGAYEMNMLLTAIEKVMLAIDPNAQVSTRDIKVKTKSSFI